MKKLEDIREKNTATGDLVMLGNQGNQFIFTRFGHYAREGSIMPQGNVLYFKPGIDLGGILIPQPIQAHFPTGIYGKAEHIYIGSSEIISALQSDERFRCYIPYVHALNGEFLRFNDTTLPISIGSHSGGKAA
ncbi:hypothetical protein KW787_03755 [Candidatus Pacearchaeota archaeon]|nr:hypothetical protein [Candidatus Pacearchaeota archaeon]